MAKKTTLETLAAQIAKGFASLSARSRATDARVEKGFASADKKFMALADDIADIKQAMATKEHIIALRTQVNSIEAQLKRANVEIRLADLEDKVFGAARR